MMKIRRMMKILSILELVSLGLLGLISAISGGMLFYYGFYTYGFYSYFIALGSIIIVKLIGFEEGFRNIGEKKE